MRKVRTKKILITGADGFLGHHLREELKNYKYEPHLFSKNLKDFQAVRNTMLEAKPDIVIHLAALVNLSRDFDIGLKCIDNNIKGTYHLLESFRHHQPKLLLFSSSEEVYGSTPFPYDENGPVDPPSPYAISKLAAEQFCLNYAKELGFNLVIFRIGTMYGPGQNFDRFLPSIIRSAVLNQEILLNSGKKARDYIYVSDVTSAMIKALSVNFKYPWEIINLGGGKSYRLIEVVEKILMLTKSSSKVLVGRLSDRIGEANEWLMDIRKAKKILNWQPLVTLEEGLKMTINYYQKNV